MSLYAYTCSQHLVRDTATPKAVAELREHKMEAFSIMRAERRKVTQHKVRNDERRKLKNTAKPTWGIYGYVFVHDPCFRTVAERCPHVRQKVMFNGRFQPVPPAVERWLMAPPKEIYLYRDMDLPTHRPAPSVQPGDALRVIDGPFAGWDVTAFSVSPDGSRLETKIWMLNREVKAVLRAEQVEKAA